MTDFLPVAGGDERPGEPIDPRHDAFVALCAARRSNIVRLCTSILHDASAAVDATEEAFATMWRAILEGRDDAYRVPWLRAVAHDHCFDILRERKRTQSTCGTSIRGALPTLGAYKAGFGATVGGPSTGEFANPLHGLNEAPLSPPAGVEPRTVRSVAGEASPDPSAAGASTADPSASTPAPAASVASARSAAPSSSRS